MNSRLTSGARSEALSSVCGGKRSARDLPPALMVSMALLDGISAKAWPPDLRDTAAA